MAWRSSTSASKRCTQALNTTGCGSVHRHASVPAGQQSPPRGRPGRSPRGRASSAGSTCCAKLLVASTCMAAKSATDRLAGAQQLPHPARPPVAEPVAAHEHREVGGATRSLVLTMWPLAGLTTCGKASPLAQPTQSCAPSPPGCGQSPSPARRTGMRPVVNWPMPARSATSRFCTGEVIAPPHGPPPPRRPPGSAPAARSPRRPRATGWPSPPRTRCRGRRVAGQVADHRAMPGLAHRDLLVRRRRGRRCAPRAW